ncbi:MAG TPA: branched-chain amino acid ABC transporter permease [Hyphomicrobiales bacterium]|jgi:branched-chain amino acid transport system permease protein
MARTGSNLRISYLEANEVLARPYQKVLVGLLLIAAVLLPLGVSTFFVYLINLCLLASIGALGLMMLTGFCGQISLGHAAFLAIGAFTTVMLAVHAGAPFLIVLPTAALAGAAVGFLVGLPSLRFRAVYLAISTLAMHYAIIFLATSYQANFGPSASAGITIPSPSIGPLVLQGDHAWYYFLLIFVTLVTIACLNLVRTRPGRAWMAIRDREIAAESLGINVSRYKLLAFMTSSTLASIAGSLLAYYTNVVTVETYTLDLAVIYVAMIIVGGMGSILGSLMGAFFVTLLPFVIDDIFSYVPRSWRFGSTVFGVQVGAVGACIILFLLFEPKGLAEIWRRVETYFVRWPFRYRPLDVVRR